MANFLVRNGFNIKKVDDSEINKNFKVFLFHDSPLFRETMNKFHRQEG